MISRPSACLHPVDVGRSTDHTGAAPHRLLGVVGGLQGRDKGGVGVRGGGPLPPPPTAGSGPRPVAAPSGGSSAGAGCRAGWRAAPPGCRVKTGGGCRRKRSAASWGGSDAEFPAAGPCRRNTDRQMRAGADKFS